MRESSFSFLKEYVDAISPSGFEEKAARIWRDRAEEFADEVRGDLHGNSFAVVNPGGSPRIMFAGHTDEIGLMVSNINDKGFLFFNTIGGWDPQILVGQRVRLLGKEGVVKGVIGRRPVHLLEEEDKKKVVKPEQLWIDIGAEDKDQASERVGIGTPAVLDYGFSKVNDGLVAARGFDDKGGGFVVLEALRLLAGSDDLDAEVHAVATVQEEVGLRGAQTSAFGIDPDIGVAVDVGFATDTPMNEVDKRKVGDTEIGKGPILTKGANVNPRVFEAFKSTAEELDIPHQITGTPGGTGTDANAIQLTRSGVATGLLSLPVRYMHNPCELLDLADLERTTQLLAEGVKGLRRDDLLPF